ncbi:MAG: 4Fe-4S dicluster domain-containing protein [Methanobacteriaceae archaeon]
MIKIDADLCKGCDLCIISCPKEVYGKSNVSNKKNIYLPVVENEEECTKCHICEIICPDQAITVSDDNDCDTNTKDIGED